jgi:para-nitrobenzyl esterase
MTFRNSPSLGTDLSPGMFELHEAAVERRRAAGNQPWNWNTGLASPALSTSSSH